MAGPISTRRATSAGRMNNNGQVIGAKGEDTRRRIMDATALLLESISLRDLRIADITGAAKTSKASFYVYFDTVSDIVLALLDEIPPSDPARYGLALETWTATTAPALASAFIDRYTAVWGSRAALMRVRNLASEEGDARFITARRRAIFPLQEALAARVDALRNAGHLPGDMHGFSTAAVLLALLERFVSAVRIVSGERGMTYHHMLAAAAHIFATTLATPDSGPVDGR